MVIENLFDVEWNEAQFDAESRLRDEVEPVSELHFTPGNPRNVRVGMAFLFRKGHIAQEVDDPW